MMFPEDATFTKVDQNPSTRMYILKFNSSDDRHFVSCILRIRVCCVISDNLQFWMQSGSSARDEEFAKNVNALLADPSTTLTWPSESSTSGQASASTSASGASSSSIPAATPEQLAQLQSLMNSMAGSTAGRPGLSECYLFIMFLLY